MHNPSRFRVYPYKQGSRSAKALSRALGGKVLRLQGSRYKPKLGDVVVNWGSSENIFLKFPWVMALNMTCKEASCKLTSLRTMLEEGVMVPPFTTSKEDWGPKDFPIVCRTKLKGHSGEGIVIANSKEELVDAPLYTKYIKKKDEYRVHVCGGDAFFVQRKAKKNGVENPDWMIRNLAGGFSFVEVAYQMMEQDGRWDCPSEVIRQSIMAASALGLDFGGVDVIWNDKEQKAYVLEVNTACGLEARTAERYASAIRDLIKV